MESGSQSPIKKPKLLSFTEYITLRKLITAEMNELDKLVKSHRMSQNHSQEVFQMYLDR